jgi:hypothetical protein
MNRLFILAMMLLSSTAAWAQQDLKDPRYIYHLEKEGANYFIQQMSVHPNAPHYYIAGLYKGTLYKTSTFIHSLQTVT